MFIGHFAVGMGAKKIVPKPSLGTLFIASQFIDLLWPVLLLLGWESVKVDPGNTVVTPLDFLNYPFSHSFLMTVVWGVLAGGVYYLIKKDKKSMFGLGLLVVSHWLLDFFTHRPDLPIYPGGSKVGLGLWNSLTGTIVFELLLFCLGIYFYLRKTQAKNKTGIYSFWGLVGFLLIIYFNNLFGAPPPDSQVVIGLVGLSQWLLIAWGYWIDRNRRVI